MPSRRITFLAILACVGALFATGYYTYAKEGESPKDGESWRKTDVACLTDESLSSLRQNAAELQNLFLSCKREFKGSLGETFSHLSDNDLYVAFASVVTHRMAPYGKSAALLLDRLLSEPVLDCDNYAALAGHFAQDRLGGNARFRIVGFDGGAIGNHAQIFYENGPTRLLLDPTIGLVALIDFNHVMRGIPVTPERIVDTYKWADTRIGAFRSKVVTALLDGRYRPSDLLYFFEDMSHFLEFSNNQRDRPFVTPGGVSLRMRR